MNRFKDLKVIGEGSFGIVYLAEEKETQTLVAIKRMKRRYNSWEECMNLREVRSLRKIRHPNIIKLREVFREENQLHLVFDYAESNLFKFYSAEFKHKGSEIPEQFIKRVIYQTLRGLEHLHAKGFFHRDLKPENLLVDSEKNIKIADFGLAREIRSMPPYTDYISTRWYRAPEILLKMPNYSHPVDIFALGCIMAELFLGRPMFDGKSEMDQLHKIFSVLGYPKKWPEGLALAAKLGIELEERPARSLKLLLPRASPDAINLLQKMFQLDPKKRGSANSLMQHPFFNGLSEKIRSGNSTEHRRNSLELNTQPNLNKNIRKKSTDKKIINKRRKSEKNDISKINPDLYSQLMNFKLKQRNPPPIPEEKSQKSEDDSFFMPGTPHDEEFLKQSLMENKSLTEEIDTIINRKSQPIISLNTRERNYLYPKNKTLNAIEDGHSKNHIQNNFGSGVESFKKFQFATNSFQPVNPLYNSKPFHPSTNNLLSKNSVSKKCFLPNPQINPNPRRLKPSQSFTRGLLNLTTCEPSFLRSNHPTPFTPKSGLNIDIPGNIKLSNANFQKLTPKNSNTQIVIPNKNFKNKTKKSKKKGSSSPDEYRQNDKIRSPENKENLKGFQPQTSSKDLLPSYMMFLGPKHEQNEFKFHF